MATKSEKMYDAPPTLARGESGKVEVKKAPPKGKEDAGPDEKISDLHSRHEREIEEIHSRHEDEMKKIHARHKREAKD